VGVLIQAGPQIEAGPRLQDAVTLRDMRSDLIVLIEAGGLLFKDLR